MRARFREFARLLACAAKTHAEEGDLRSAARDAADAIELGVIIPRGGGLIDSLVGAACAAIGHQALGDLADRLDAPTARATALRLESLERRRWSYAHTLIEERRLNHFAIRHLYDGGPARAWRNAETWMHDPRMKAKFVYDGPRTTVENTDRWMDTLAARSEQPWGNQQPLPPLPPDLYSQIVLPIYGQYEYKIVHARANAALARTYLAMRAHRLERGAYPESLEALSSAGYLKASPIDAFSPTRSLLGYRRESAGRMTLWSVGPDAKDDAGIPIVERSADGKVRRGYIRAESKGDIVARVNTW
jgi:hypothetical protein